MWNKIWYYLKKVFLWLYIWVHTIVLRISIALYNVEESILKADPNDLDEKNKFNLRMRHRNPLVEKMLQGQRDEQFVSDYYEILKKADKFLRESTPDKIEMAAGKWGLNYGKSEDELKNVGKTAKRIKRDKDGKIIRTKPKGNSGKRKKDKFGRRYEHYGFFDPKNRNYGKTLAQVMKEEVGERVTSDDKYPIEFMFTNKAVEDGISKNDEVVETMTDKSNTGFESKNELDKALERKFPMRIVRENEVVNKLERLTEFLHVKKINSKHRILEFFIPAKYKTFDITEESDIFAEIVGISQVWISDEYGEMYGFTIKDYRKRLTQNIIITEEGEKIEKPIYEVIKLNGQIIEKL